MTSRAINTADAWRPDRHRMLRPAETTASIKPKLLRDRVSMTFGTAVSAPLPSPGVRATMSATAGGCRRYLAGSDRAL
jgi:hypothetical protein